MPNNDEIILVVDKHNKVVGSTPRHLMNFETQFHRVTYILIINTKGNLLVQKRTANKAFCPGYYGITTGGVVDKGESYIDSAHRELKEELGFDAPLESHGVFLTQGKGFNIWGKIYSCHYNPDLHGELILEPDEVASIHEMSIDSILKNTDALLFMPDTLDALHHYINKLTKAQHNDPL